MYRHAALLPKAMLHPAISATAFATFLRGEYDIAIFACQLNRSMQHHLIEIIFFRGGVDEARKTVRALCGAEGRDMAPLEGGRVVA
jgi:hypothetical protein